MKYNVVETNRFKKSLKRCAKINPKNEKNKNIHNEEL